MAAIAGLPSKNAVTKAGDVVRRWMLQEMVDPSDYQDALWVIDAHRRSHKQPTLTANVSLRRFCQSLRLESVVTQRIKRMDTVHEKLLRQPKMKLGRMQDFGGCRVVVKDEAALRRLEGRIIDSREVVRHDDYIKEPRDSGYRAVHIVAPYGHEVSRPVEIQLRTEIMHEWADMVEDVSGMLGLNYKQDGDEEFQEWARVVSEVMTAVEHGHPAGRELIARQTRSWEQLFARLDGGRR